MDDYETDQPDEVNEGPDEIDADLMDDDLEQLVPCPACGRAISEFAQQCSHCGDWITPAS
jgi:cytidine deaminase